MPLSIVPQTTASASHQVCDFVVCWFLFSLSLFFLRKMSCVSWWLAGEPDLGGASVFFLFVLFCFVGFGFFFSVSPSCIVCRISCGGARKRHYHRCRRSTKNAVDENRKKTAARAARQQADYWGEPAYEIPCMLLVTQAAAAASNVIWFSFFLFLYFLMLMKDALFVLVGGEPGLGAFCFYLFPFVLCYFILLFFCFLCFLPYLLQGGTASLRIHLASGSGYSYFLS